MKNLIKKGVQICSIATLAGFLALGPVACAHKEQSAKTYPAAITRYTDEGVETYDKDSIILETLTLGSKTDQDIGDIIRSVNPSAFKLYKSHFDTGWDFSVEKIIISEGLVKRPDNIDGKKIYEGITVSEDKEIMLVHQIWKCNNRKTSEGYDVYYVKECISEEGGNFVLPSYSGHAIWFEEGDLPWLEGSEREYISKNKEKKMIRHFFKIEEKNGKLDIKGYGSGGKTYYQQYDTSNKGK